MQTKNKKWLAILLAVVMAVCIAIGLAACVEDPDDEGGDDEITLAAPVVELSDNVLSWGAVEDATRYIVYEDGEAVGNVNAPETSYTITKSVEGSWEYTVAAYNADANPKTGPKSNTVTYTYTVPVGGGDEGNECECPDCACDDCTDCTNCECPDCTDNGNGDDNGNGEVVPTQLETPVVAIEGNALNWQPIDDATSYDIYKNGEMVDSIESFTFLFEDYLPTTYTITDATNGDKYQVVAVSGSDDVEDSELSNEVEFVAMGDVLSATNSIYITNSTTYLYASLSQGGQVWKVIFKPNNDTHTSLGEEGTASVHVYSNNTNEAPYSADAVYDDELGAYVATIVIVGDNDTQGSDYRLRLSIVGTFDNVTDLTLGYTVSLADPYEGSSGGVVAEYTLNATGSLEVDIPYVGHSIKINVGSDVKTPYVLYVELEDGDTSAGINAGGALMNIRDGYYESNSLSSSSILLYNNDYISLKATISFELPEVAFTNMPSLVADMPNYDATHVGHGEAAKTPLNVSGIDDGNYTLVIAASGAGFSFYAQLDDGNAVKLTGAGSIYSLNVTISGHKVLYLYEYTSASDNIEGVDVSWVALYSAGGKFYHLSAEAPVEEALIGNSAANATVLYLNRVSDGNYTLTIIGSSAEMTFVVTVGSNTYTVSGYVNNWPEYLYTADIEIAGEESISIYCENGVYVANVSLTLMEEEVLPELTHGSEGTKFVLSAQQGAEASQSFTLKDVPNGTYTLALRGFVGGSSYDDWVNLSVIVGSKTVKLCDSNAGYLDDQTIVIEGETELKVVIPSYHGTLTLTIYLLADGEEIGGGNGGGGTGGSATSASKSVTLEAYMYSAVDVSELAYGVYSITIEGVTADWLGNYAYFYAKSNLNDDDEIWLSQGNDWTDTITIDSGSIYLWASDESTVTVKLEKIGDLPGAGGAGGSETSKTINYILPGYGWNELDVSDLQYGEYTLSLTSDNFLGSYYIATMADYSDEMTVLPGGSITITISSGSIYINGGWGDELTITLVKVGGGDVVGGGSGTYLNKTVEVGAYYAYAGGPATLDVSDLEYGEYRIFFVITGFCFEEIQTVYFTCNSTLDDGVDVAVNPQTWGTITINSDTLYIYSFYIPGVEISVELEKV